MVYTEEVKPVLDRLHVMIALEVSTYSWLHKHKLQN